MLSLPASYEISATIGKGSSSKVYRVANAEGEDFALKFIKKSFYQGICEREKRIADEITMLRMFDRDDVCRIRGSFETDEGIYILMKLYECDLYNVLEKKNVFSECGTRKIGMQLLDVLVAIHEKNIVYRDLKLENVMLDDQMNVVLCDFGISEILEGKNLFKTNCFCGTPEYFAPEMILHDAYGVEIDWWQFGIFLYEMLVGIPPFQEEELEELFDAILDDKILFPPDMSKTAEDLIRKLTRKDPMKRLTDPLQIRIHPFFSKSNL